MQGNCLQPQRVSGFRISVQKPLRPQEKLHLRPSCRLQKQLHRSSYRPQEPGHVSRPDLTICQDIEKYVDWRPRPFWQTDSLPSRIHFSIFSRTSPHSPQPTKGKGEKTLHTAKLPDEDPCMANPQVVQWLWRLYRQDFLRGPRCQDTRQLPHSFLETLVHFQSSRIVVVARYMLTFTKKCTYIS